MKEKIAEILKGIAGGANFEVFVPEEDNFGHYSTNAPFAAAKKFGRNPLELAREWAEKAMALAPPGFFEKAEAAPPGFVNFWIAPRTIQDEFEKIFPGIAEFGAGNSGKGRTAIVEYSQPNIAKTMHVGHLRTTIIGDALANILEFSGWRVVRWNYLGDWGTQFGNLIAAYKLWGPSSLKSRRAGEKNEIARNPIPELQKLYVRFHEEMKSNPALAGRGQEEFRKLEAGDKENMKLWERFRRESVAEFEKTYRALDVKFDDWRGESFFRKDAGKLPDELLRLGLAEKSEGAVVVPLSKCGLPPALIRKSDGATLYLTRDIAALAYRLKKFRPAKMIYVVGNEQALHFEQLFAVAGILGLGKNSELMHAKYGLILGEESKKLATREGRSVALDEVLGKAVRLAREAIEEKNRELPAREKDAAAASVGIGSVKYAILKENPLSDIVFDWRKMLDFRGESAPYIQYTCARLRSILRKSGTANAKVHNFEPLDSEIELALMRRIVEFPDAAGDAAKNLKTNIVALYAYRLAVLANKFYETMPVLREEDLAKRGARLALVSAAAEVLRRGLALLGIGAPEEI